jgi:hypothetical protein
MHRAPLDVMFFGPYKKEDGLDCCLFHAESRAIADRALVSLSGGLRQIRARWRVRSVRMWG